MKSMTGFGRGTVSTDNFSITVELKTVNNRFLDINLRLPGELQPIEADIKRLISSTLIRGRVEVFTNFERTESVIYELNRPLISGYLNALKKMQDEFGLAGEPDLNVIARLPNVLLNSKENLDEKTTAGILEAFKIALTQLEEMRQNEGNSLKVDLSSRLDAIANIVPAIEEQSETVAIEYQEKLTKRISDLLSKTSLQIEIDQTRLAQEVAFLVDKCDITEEITRLKTHLEQFRMILQDTKDVGKRLDFLTQEFNREANTIASKTNNTSIKECALSIKSEIEKIREQVQNIE
jgi:uncharacterized protein (TIGR00255 family)